MSTSPNQEPQLRRQQASDAAFLCELYRSTRESELAGLPWTEAQKAAFCDMQFRAQSAGYLHTYPQAEHLLVCTASGESAGRLIKARTEGALQLIDISLLPPFRRRGWGSRLIGALQQEAAASHIAVLLSVIKVNPALALYRRLGFSIVGEQDIRFEMAWAPEKQGS